MPDPWLVGMFGRIDYVLACDSDQYDHCHNVPYTGLVRMQERLYHLHGDNHHHDSDRRANPHYHHHFVDLFES